MPVYGSSARLSVISPVPMRKKTPRCLRQRSIGLVDQIADVAEHFERGVVRQIFLQITIAAIHRAVAGEIDDEIIAAHLAVAARTFLEELALVPGKIKLLLRRAETVAIGEITDVHRVNVLDNCRNGTCGKRPAQVAVDRTRLRAALDDHFFGLKIFPYFDTDFTVTFDLSSGWLRRTTSRKFPPPMALAAASLKFAGQRRATPPCSSALNSTCSRPPSKPGGTLKRICGEVSTPGSFSRISSSIAARRGNLSRRSCSLMRLSLIGPAQARVGFYRLRSLCRPRMSPMLDIDRAAQSLRANPSCRADDFHWL